MASGPTELCTLPGDRMPLKVRIDYNTFSSVFGWSNTATSNLFKEAARIWYRETGAKFNFIVTSQYDPKSLFISAADFGPYIPAQTDFSGIPPCYPNGTACCPTGMYLSTNSAFRNYKPTISGNFDGTPVTAFGFAVLHEFGHVIGLGHPTSGGNEETIMYPTNTRVSFTWEDIVAARHLYGRRSQGIKHWLYPWCGNWASLEFSCVSSWWGGIIAVGCDADYDYP